MRVATRAGTGAYHTRGLDTKRDVFDTDRSLAAAARAARVGTRSGARRASTSRSRPSAASLRPGRRAARLECIRFGAPALPRGSRGAELLAAPRVLRSAARACSTAPCAASAAAAASRASRRADAAAASSAAAPPTPRNASRSAGSSGAAVTRSHGVACRGCSNGRSAAAPRSSAPASSMEAPESERRPMQSGPSGRAAA